MELNNDYRFVTLLWCLLWLLFAIMIIMINSCNQTLCIINEYQVNVISCLHVFQMVMLVFYWQCSAILLCSETHRNIEAFSASAYDSLRWIFHNTFNESVITANKIRKTKITEQTDGYKNVYIIMICLVWLHVCCKIDW